ncbi:hypothetical protein [Ketogulonicigenium vulgare]|uniref:hypothetical protein n=1 Tax=Ketogulonicigenium vulgare TaxID=92945 RepID=UPI0020C82DA7|nr:hypothetical protein [Ketogulonicigenium vulgare]
MHGSIGAAIGCAGAVDLGDGCGAHAQVSPFADLAADISVNHGGAEEVFRLSPDLVLASDYTPIATLDLLRRLGLRVEQFAPEYSFDDIRTNTARMGALLGQDAGALIADFDAGLARISTPTRPIRAVIYGANGFASAGPGLPQAVLDAAVCKTPQPRSWPIAAPCRWNVLSC